MGECCVYIYCWVCSCTVCIHVVIATVIMSIAAFCFVLFCVVKESSFQTIKYMWLLRFDWFWSCSGIECMWGVSCTYACMSL